MVITREQSFIEDFQNIELNDEEFQCLCNFVAFLSAGKPLPPESKDHALEGEWQSFREFHLGGDNMVIYRKEGDDVKLYRLGKHTQLYKKM